MNATRKLSTVGIGFLASVVVLAAADRLPAQSNSMFGSRGPAGQIGSNALGSSVGRGSTMGTTSGMSGQPLTGNTMGMGTSGAAASTGRMSTTTGEGGFIGRQDNSGRFIGNQGAGQQTTRGRTTNRSARSNTRRSTNQNEFNNQDSRNNNRSSKSRMIVRPQQRIAFTYPERSAGTIESSLETRFGLLSIRQSGLSGVAVTSEPQGIVVLTGEVDSEENKRLAAVLVRLEPGVRSVRNELTVRGAAE